MRLEIGWQIIHGRIKDDTIDRYSVIWGTGYYVHRDLSLSVEFFHVWNVCQEPRLLSIVDLESVLRARASTGILSSLRLSRRW